MFFLLRMAFWLSLAFLLLPSGGSKQRAALPSAEVTAGDALSSATGSVTDMRQFCTRHADACAIGTRAAIAFGQRAQAGVKIVSDFIHNERAAPHTAGSTATKPARPAAPSHAKSSPARSSQDTLGAADLAPGWRRPAREARDKHGA